MMNILISSRGVLCERDFLSVFPICSCVKKNVKGWPLFHGHNGPQLQPHSQTLCHRGEAPALKAYFLTSLPDILHLQNMYSLFEETFKDEYIYMNTFKPNDSVQLLIGIS